MTVEAVIIDDEDDVKGSIDVVEQPAEAHEYPNIDQEQYFIWKKNAPILYDHIQTTSLLWPSLSVQFFPDVERYPTHNKYRLLTGTFTSQQSTEYITINDIKVKTKYDINPKHYDADKQEIMDNSNSQFKSSILQKIKHEGEVNKARYMPQNADLIATISGSGSVSIFDRTKHPSQPASTFKSEIALSYHKQDGFGLSWNVNKEGELLTGASDGLVCLYDITKWSQNEALEPKVFVAHDNGVNDLKFLYETDSIFGSVGEDRKVKIWDKRKEHSNILSSELSSPINSMAPHPTNQFIVAVGDNEGSIKTYDLRNFQDPIFLNSGHHSLPISCLEWNFHNRSILASGSEDKTVKIWDMSQTQNDNGLLFVHGGHLFGVNDISWNPNDEKMLASVSDDNTLQVWQPSV